MNASGDSNISAFEIWNEPDWTWDTTEAGRFDAGWVDSFDEIRNDDSTPVIHGPSYSTWNASWMTTFLTYAKANGALPNFLSWHELNGAGEHPRRRGRLSQAPRGPASASARSRS